MLTLLYIGKEWFLRAIKMSARSKQAWTPRPRGDSLSPREVHHSLAKSNLFEGVQWTFIRLIRELLQKAWSGHHHSSLFSSLNRKRKGLIVPSGSTPSEHTVSNALQAWIQQIGQNRSKSVTNRQTNKHKLGFLSVCVIKVDGDSGCF